MNWIVFYDGECGLCSESVAFVARCDKRREFSFASLQGKLSKERGFEKYADLDGGTMVVQRESDGKIFLHSAAWLEIVRALGGWWTLLTIFSIIPKGIRDAVYRWIAKNRHYLVGNSRQCRLPDSSDSERFLD